MAELAGGDWPSKARAAAVALSSANNFDDSEDIEIKFLSDTRQVFQEQYLNTTDLIDKLCALEESPWSEYGRKRMRINPKQLASIAKGMDIFTKLKGSDRKASYEREDFILRWNQYLPPDSDPLMLSFNGGHGTEG